MHLGLILPSFGTNAATQIPSLSLLANGLSTRINVTVIPLRNPPGFERSNLEDVNVFDPAGISMRFRSVARRTIELVRERHRMQPFDLLHAYWLFEPGVIAVAAGRLLNIPVVASIGGAELVSLPEIGYGGLRTIRGRLLNGAVLKSANTITGGSEYVLDLARVQTPTVAHKLRLVPLPVERATEACQDETPYLNDGYPRLLQVGAYLPVKGQDLAIRALAVLQRDYPEISLSLVGEDPYGHRERMQDLALHLGLATRVQFTNRLPHDRLRRYFQHADLLLMPSRHESQGMVVLEAAAHGLPTAGANVGVVRDLAPDGAVAFPVGDYRELAGAAAQLLGDDERRTGVGRRARRIVEEHYSREPVIKRWLKLYDGVAGGS